VRETFGQGRTWPPPCLRALTSAPAGYSEFGVGIIHREAVKLQKLCVNTVVGASKYR
jgi:hypothetical protein